jgi:hypothetical protein
LRPGVRDGLAERSAGRVEPLGQDADRDDVERDSDEYLALVRAALALCGLLQRPEALLRSRSWWGVELRVVIRPSPRLEENGPVCPGGEAPVAAELIELDQYGEEHVIGALMGQVVVIVGGALGKRPAAGVSPHRGAFESRPCDAWGASSRSGLHGLSRSTRARRSASRGGLGGAGTPGADIFLVETLLEPARSARLFGGGEVSKTAVRARSGPGCALPTRGNSPDRGV